MFSIFKRIGVSIIYAALILALVFVGYNMGKASPPTDKNLATIEDAWNIIHQNYVEPSSVDSTALSQAAVQAFMDTLADSHSAYVDVFY